MHYLAVPPVAFAGRHRGARRARPGQGQPGRLREAVRHVGRGLPRARQDGALGARRGAGLPDRPLPGQGGDAEPARLRFANGLFDAMWDREHIRAVQIDVPEKLGISRPRRVLRRHRRGARHARHAPVPAGRRDRDGAAGEPDGRRPAGRPRGGHRLLPRRSTPTEVVLGQFEGYTRRRRRREGLEHRHLRRGAALGRQRPLARRAVPAAHRQAAGVQPAAGQPHPARARGHAGRRAQARQRPRLRPQRQRRASSCGWWPSGPARRSNLDVADVGLELDVAARRRPAAALRPAHPRRAASATARCSPVPTAWPRCGRPPARCSTTRRSRSPTRQGSWGPEAARELAEPDGWLLGG